MSTHSRGTLFVVCAPSGAGKTSLVRALVDAVPQMGVSVSHTTRARRPSEREGQDYYYVDRATFERMIGADDLLEHACVFDHYYGTSAAWVAQALRERDVVLEIDWQGARQVRAAFPTCITIQILPPSLQALEDRLRRRGQDPEIVIERRMAEAVEEMTHLAEFDYLVINDDFEVALERLRAIVLAERSRTTRMRDENATLVAQLLDPAG